MPDVATRVVVLRVTGNMCLTITRESRLRAQGPIYLRSHRLCCRFLRRRGHIDVRFAVDDGQERPGDVLPRELRVRSFYDTKGIDEAALAASGPDIHLLALLFAIGTFARENSGERFGVRPCVVAPPFDTDRAPAGDLTVFASADCGGGG